MSIFGKNMRLYADEMIKKVEKQIEQEESSKEKQSEERMDKEFCEKIIKLVEEKYSSNQNT